MQPWPQYPALAPRVRGILSTEDPQHELLPPCLIFTHTHGAELTCAAPAGSVYTRQPALMTNFAMAITECVVMISTHSYQGEKAFSGRGGMKGIPCSLSKAPRPLPNTPHFLKSCNWEIQLKVTCPENLCQETWGNAQVNYPEETGWAEAPGLKCH